MLRVSVVIICSKILMAGWVVNYMENFISTTKEEIKEAGQKPGVERMSWYHTAFHS